MTHAFVLYQRDDCHLCDQAVAVLAQARAGDFASVFVDGDAALEARYGVRVPVLADAHGRELDWPFDAARLRAWLAAAPGGKDQDPAHGRAGRS